jgi:RimJ/RimL family protein N-acetyltransferase
MIGIWRGSRSPRALDAATIARLDTFATAALDCPVRVARRGGVHLLASRSRLLPAWHGYVVPILGISFPTGAVLTARPDFAEQLRGMLGSDLTRASWDSAAIARVLRAVRGITPFAFTLGGEMRAADPQTFQPSLTERRAERVDREDPTAADVRRRFDGEIFGVRGPQGGLISWAALKLKSDDVWEIAVVTRVDYRGRGYARDVVSAATRYCLEQGRLCLYVHDQENRTSAFVARALGYVRYADVVLAEY